MPKCDDVLKCIETNPELRRALQSEGDVGRIDSANICRIHVHARAFDWTQPPNRNKGGSGTGTGFILDAFPTDGQHVFIVTAHHVVAHSVQIRVNFAKISSEYVEASVVGSNADMDVAILAVDLKAMGESADGESLPGGLICGNSDEITPPATVTAHGFALGKPHMQTTKGVVSGRIEGPSRLQTDVAVNPGNSGGPLLDETNRVIGIVTSGMVDAQGINYVAPITEACIILKRCQRRWTALATKAPIADRLPSLNCSFSKGNRILLAKVDGCKSGVFCTSVHPLVEYPQTREAALDCLRRNLPEYAGDEKYAVRLEKQLSNPDLVFPNDMLMTRSNWHMFVAQTCTSDPDRLHELVNLLRRDSVQEGDLVCAIVVNDKRYDIDLQMTSKFEFWRDNIGFGAILDRLTCADADGTPVDTVAIELYRDAHIRSIPIQLQPQLNTFRRMHADNESVSFMVAGGIFVMSLTHNHIPIFRREPLYTLMTRPQSRHESLLIITHILPESPFNECETVGAGDVVVALNNSPTPTLAQFKRAWDEESALGDEHVLTLRMRDGSLASATNAQIRERNEKIRVEYKSDDYVGHHVVDPGA